MADDFPVPNLDGAIAQLVEGLLDPAKLQRVERAVGNAVAYGTVAADGAIAAAAQAIDYGAQNIRENFEKAMGGVSAWVMALVVERAFNVPVSGDAFFRLGASGDRRAVSRAVAAKMIEGLTGGATSIEPSPAPAANYLDVVLGQALESWAIGAMTEIGSCVLPIVEQIQTVGELGNRIVNALGIGDSSSRVLRPYIDNLVVEPLRRYIDQKYRPALLTPTLAAQQIHRGRGDAEHWRNELRLQGFDEARIEAVIASQQKFLSAEQLAWLEWNGIITRAEAVQTLRDQGYDEQNASKQLNIRTFEREDTISRRIATDAMAAFEARQINERELRGFLEETIFSGHERDLMLNAARSRRVLNIARMSKGDIEQAVRVGISTFVDYRDWLRRGGYNEDDVVTLELLLRWEIDRARDIELHRAELLAERAAEKLARDEERAAKRAAVEADRAAARRGAETDLEDAAVRGLVPFARVEELYRAKYDADTSDVLVALLEERRQTYLDTQRQRAAAVQRGAQRAISEADLETAVLSHVLTLDQYRAGVAGLGFTAADADVLARTLDVRVRERDAAQHTRAVAVTTAARKGINVAKFEQLVRRGVRTLSQYTALLDSLNFDEAAIAAMVELLELEIADDRAADQARREADARLRSKGLSLEQLRRLVVLELAPASDYETLLGTEGFTADAQVLLMRELGRAVAGAEAARARRAQAPLPPETRDLPLTTVARAARLGLVSPATYADRLSRAGYGADDIAIEMDLLLTEIADVQAARTARDETPAPIGDTELSLAELARAVKRGLSSLDVFRARAVTLGLSKDAVATQVRILGDELSETALAKTRRAAIDAELKERKISLAELETAVGAGTLTIDRFVEQLTLNGLTREDAELLGAILLDAGESI